MRDDSFVTLLNHQGSESSILCSKEQEADYSDAKVMQLVEGNPYYFEKPQRSDYDSAYAF